MAIHLWHDLPSGPTPPDTMYVVVEVPKGTNNKYEYSKSVGVIKLDRVLYSPMHYPGDYGMIPRSLFDDGDPMDVLVMLNEPTFPGCVIEARPVAMFKMVDEGQPDWKVLAVPATDPFFNGYHDLGDLPPHYPKAVGHFFLTYKQLQGSEVTSDGWVGAAEAKAAVLDSLQKYQARFPQLRL